MSSAQRLTCIDLFCGCGGFSLGMARAGFNVLAAIDSDTNAIETFRKNLPDVPHKLLQDLTKFTAEALAELLGTSRVDVVVGGPPCQGFSKVRRVDGSNNGERLKVDGRRDLYQEFLRYVHFFKPRVFVMENVLGLRSAVGGEYFTAVQKESRSLGYRVHSHVEDAWALGVPQMRKRQLVVGVRGDMHGYFPPDWECPPRATPNICLWDAIGDLPIMKSDSGLPLQEYDLDRRKHHLRTRGRTASKYLREVLEIDRAKGLANHDARPHSERDLRDFARLREGENSRSAVRERHVEFEFPYDKTHFKDRYTRQNRWGPCSTIVAHMSKDGLMFIHPTQNRSLTPREAARIQSFPDWFVFPDSRTHAYRLVGNAVPPLVAEAVGLAVTRFLATAPQGRRVLTGGRERDKQNCERAAVVLARQRRGADPRVTTLGRFIDLDGAALRVLATDELLAGWRALLSLFPSLHPCNALDHGYRIEVVPPSGERSIQGGELFSRRYARSGWPVALAGLGREIWRRFEKGQISHADVFCIQANMAGDRKEEKDGCPGSKGA